MTNDAPQSVSISEHHGKARRTRYRLAISDIGERVVTCVDPDVTIDSDILLAEDHSCLRAFSGILEILGDRGRVRSNRLCGRPFPGKSSFTTAPRIARRHAIPTILRPSRGRRQAPSSRRITTIVCGTPSRSRGCHLICSTGSTNPGTRCAGGQQGHRQHSKQNAHDYLLINWAFSAAGVRDSRK